MYDKKYRLQNIESGYENPIHTEILGKVCFIAYLKIGERGWFLCDTETEFGSVCKVHTSKIEDVQYTRGNQIIVYTKNTKYLFKAIVNDGVGIEQLRRKIQCWNGM